MDSYTNHGKKVKIIAAYECGTANLIGQTGIIVKASEYGYNVFQTYYTFPNYQDNIYFFPFNCLEIIPD